MDAERLAAPVKVGEAAERVGADQDPFIREPERHLLPALAAHDRAHLERRAFNAVEGNHV